MSSCFVVLLFIRCLNTFVCCVSSVLLVTADGLVDTFRTTLRNLIAAASLSLITYAMPLAQDGDLFSNCAERRCHVCKGCASLGRAADWCPKKASSLKVDTRWWSRPKPTSSAGLGATGSGGRSTKGSRRKVCFCEAPAAEACLEEGLRTACGHQKKNRDPRVRKSMWFTHSCPPHRIARSTGSTTVQCRL